MEATLKDSDRRIGISIHHRLTMRAGMRALTQRLLDQFAATGTHLRRIARVNQNDTPASFFHFGDGHSNKLRPRHVHNAFSHPAALAHLLRLKGLEYNHLKTIDQLAAFLVGKIATAVRNPLVDFRQDRLLFGILGPVFIP